VLDVEGEEAQRLLNAPSRGRATRRLLRLGFCRRPQIDASDPLDLRDRVVGRVQLFVSPPDRGFEGSPKTESSVRDVDLLPPVVEALLTQRAAQAAARLARGQGLPDLGRDYVFTMPSGRCVDPNRLREHVWNRTIARAGLRRRTMYQTRHTFASNALAAGEAPSWVAAMLGHTTPEMLFQVYARFIPNRTRRDGSALAGG
jgi:integrase